MLGARTGSGGIQTPSEAFREPRCAVGTLASHERTLLYAELPGQARRGGGNVVPVRHRAQVVFEWPGWAGGCKQFVPPCSSP